MIGALIKHEKSLHKDIKIRCQYCLFKKTVFPSQASLERHISRQHKYECPGCHRWFKSKDTYFRHQSTCSKGDKSYKCTLCVSQFMSEWLLKQHIRHQHAFNCEFCGQSFKSSQKKASKDHFKTCPRLQIPKTRSKTDRKFNRYQCKFCSKTFKLAFPYMKHESTHYLNNDQIKNEELQDEQLQHFQCKLCNKTYKFELALMKHLKRDHSFNKDSSDHHDDEHFESPEAEPEIEIKNEPIEIKNEIIEEESMNEFILPD